MRRNARLMVIGLLSDHPDGLTAVQITERLGFPLHSMSSILSKLAAYGEIDRIVDSTFSGSVRGYAYRLHRQSETERRLRMEIVALKARLSNE